MKKLIVADGGEITVGEVETPSPNPGEVLIETAVSVVCGSEVKGYKSGAGVGTNFGHEAAGTIAAVGAGVDSAVIGQRTGISAISGCGHCEHCAEQRYTWCKGRKFHPGMHGECFTVPLGACYPLPEGMSWDCGALVSGDGLGVPFHTNTLIHGGREDLAVAVFGLGPIGLGNVLLQRFLGRTVIGVDLSPTRLQMASEMGAAHLINAADADAVEGIKGLTDGRGADVCIEAVGVPKTVEQAIAAVKNGGQVMLNGEQSEVTLNPSEQLIRRDITLTGCWFYHFAEIGPMCNLVADGLDAAAIVTHRFPGTEAAEGFRLFAEAKTGKVALVWRDLD